MANSAVFPAFVKAEYDRSGNAFAGFVSDARAAGDQVQRHIKGSFDEIQKLAQRAVTLPKNGLGALDLGVDKYRQAAAAADGHAAALRQVAAAAEQLAAKQGQLSGAQQVVIASAREAAAAAARDAATKREQVVVYEQLQRELNQTAQAAGALSAANRVAASSAGQLGQMQGQAARGAGAQRMAMVQASQQFQDFFIQIQSGQSALVAFSQQASQLAFVMQNTGGAAGGLARFLSGPWGTAFIGAISLVGLFAGKLMESKDALDLAKAGSDGLSEAQGALGGIFDLTSGKIQKQNELLILNARLTAVNLRAEALKQRQSAREVFSEAGQVPVMSSAAAIFSRTGGSPGGRLAALQGRAAELRGQVDAIRNARSEAERRTARDRALRASEKGVFGGLGFNRKEFQQAIIDDASAEAKERISRLIDESLDSGKLAAGLRRAAPTKKPPKPKKPPSTAARDEFGRDAADRISEITQRFDQTPPQIAKVNKAVNDLNDLMEDLGRKKPPGFEKMIADAERAKAVVAGAINQPFEEFLRGQKEALAVQELLSAGRENEAAALQVIVQLERQMGPLGEKRRAAALATVQALQEEQRQTEILQRKQEAYLSAAADLRQNIQSTISSAFSGQGFKGLADFGKGISAAFNNLASELITQKLFDPVFRSIEDMVKGKSPLEKAEDRAADSVRDVSASFDRLGIAADNLAARLATGAGSGPVPTGRLSGLAGIIDSLSDTGGDVPTDQMGEIVVTAQRRKAREQGYNEGPAAYMNRVMAGTLGKIGEAIAGPAGRRLGDAIGSRVGTALEGSAIGSTASSFLLGKKGSSTGSAIGGALGNVLGKEVGKTFGKQLGKLAGFAGPLGSIVGGLAGGAIGKLFTSAKTGSSTIAIGSDGNLKVGSATGNSAKFKQASGNSASAAITTIERIAEALGATVTGAGSVSIGVRNGKFRVDPSGRGRTKKKGGVLDFGEDAEAAVRAATLDLIKDGILGGLRASTQRLLQGAKDLDLGLEKALKFESVFIRLKEHTDPVGAAVDKVNLAFESLKRVFTEAGASAEEFAKLEELYGLERAAAIKSAGQSTVSALKDLLEDLRTGDNGLALRDRLANARATFDPLAASIRAGKAVDNDAFAQAARNVIELQRQVSGSQRAYFDLVAEITSLTTKAIGAAATGGVPGAGLPSPFGPKPSSPANDNSAPVVSALDQLGELLVGQLGGELRAVNRNLGRLIVAGENSRGRGGWNLDSEYDMTRLRKAIERGMNGV